MELNKKLFIEKRESESLSLDGKWYYAHTPHATSMENISFMRSATLPQSAGWCMYESGELSHPYVGMNSRDYKFLSDEIWYFKRTFSVAADKKREYAYLCFDGAAYYTRVWLNGMLLGSHEGMFGGPVVEVSDILKYGEENEIVVETTPCNYGRIDDINCDVEKGMRVWPAGKSEIVPWQLTNDAMTQNGHFNVAGLWRGVRIEFLSKYHVTNPYFYTESISDGGARVCLEIPVTTPYTDEKSGISSFVSPREFCPKNSFSAGIVPVFNDDTVTLEVSLTDEETGERIYSCREDMHPYDLVQRFEGEKMQDYLYFTKHIELENVKLWYPNGFGKQNMYKVEISLCENGRLCDKYIFSAGIRKIEVVDGVNEKLFRRWEKFQFAAYPVHIEADDDDARVMCSDSFFLLCKGESRKIKVVMTSGKKEYSSGLVIKSWNSKETVL